MKKTSIIFTVIVILLAVFIVFFYPKHPADNQNLVPPTPQPTFSWQLAPSGENETAVTLIMDGQKIEAGKYEGSCAVIGGNSSSWSLLPEEVTGVICYFAGGGQEIGVFLEDGSYILKNGVVEEGDAETPGFRGQFKILKKL